MLADTVGIDFSGDSPIEQVVGVLNPGQFGARGRQRVDAGQPVAVVPGEDLVLARRPVRPPGPVSFGIVLVVVYVIGQQAVVRPGRGAGVGAVAVAVVLVVLADLAGVRGRNDLARLVVLEGAGAVDGGLHHRPAQRVVTPGGAVDLGPGTVANVLPFRQPPDGIAMLYVAQTQRQS